MSENTSPKGDRKIKAQKAKRNLAENQAQKNENQPWYNIANSKSWSAITQNALLVVFLRNENMPIAVNQTAGPICVAYALVIESRWSLAFLDLF